MQGLELDSSSSLSLLAKNHSPPTFLSASTTEKEKRGSKNYKIKQNIEMSRYVMMDTFFSEPKHPNLNYNLINEDKYLLENTKKLFVMQMVA